MAVTAADMMPTKGPLDPLLWPGEETRRVVARITQYIANAVADPRYVDLSAVAEQDAFVNALVRWQAYRDVFIRLNAQAANVTNQDKGSSAMLYQQIQAFADLMAQAETDLVAVLTDDVAESLVPPTMSVKTDTTLWAGRTHT